MKCPYCKKSELKTLETRECSNNQNRRRKECLSCGKRFTTYENIEDISIKVIKKNGSKQLYSKEKIINGIRKSCEKRDITDMQIQSIANEIDAKIIASETKEVKSTRIGLYVLNRLKKLDEVAYIRYASVHRSFNDIGTFEKEITKLQK